MLSACFKSGDVAGVFDRGALHAEADAEERHLVFARVLNGVDHALNAALAEAAGNQDAVDSRADASAAVSGESISSASIHSRTVL